MSEDASAPFLVLHYSLTRADRIAAAQRVPDRSRRRERLFTGLVLAPGFLWGMVADTLFPALPKLVFYGLAPLMLLVGLGPVLIIMRRDLRSRIAALPQATQEVTVSLFDEHLVVSAGGEEQIHFLDTPRPALSTPDHLFLQFPPDAVVILPDRAFVDAAQRAGVERHLAVARQA